MQAKFAESSEIARISAIKMRTLFRFTQKSGEILACSAGVFIGRARMVLIAKAPCWNSRREEEMGRPSGLILLLSPIFLCHRIKDGGFIVAIRLTSFRPPKIRLHCRLAKFRCFHVSFKKIKTYLRTQIKPKFVLMNLFRLTWKNAGSDSRLFTVIASSLPIYWGPKWLTGERSVHS